MIGVAQPLVTGERDAGLENRLGMSVRFLGKLSPQSMRTFPNDSCGAYIVD